MGSVNEHALKLAAMMLDSEFANQSSQNWYAVACSVDIAPSISFRLLNYSKIDGSSFITASQTTRYIVMEGNPASCNSNMSMSEVLTDALLATGAASSFGLLTERRYLDGWWPTLYTVGYYFGLEWVDANPAPFIFSNSKTVLEDALGLANAIGLGMFWGGSTAGAGYPNPVGTSSVTGLRVGSGQWWGIVYILPSVFALIMLIWLLTRVKN